MGVTGRFWDIFGVIFGDLWVIIGLYLVLFGDFRIFLDDFGVIFGDLWVILGLFWVLLGDFAIFLDDFW